MSFVTSKNRFGWRCSLGQTGCLIIGGIIVLSSAPTYAQTIREDATLGNERSTITRDVNIRGQLSDRISGGARRGQNLFHSLEQFDVGEGLGAYFENPEAVQNIFSRVTGSDASEILGRLGVIRAGSSDVLGDANLFFINPNGILFGPNSSLDVGGSFAATTADGIQFGENGFFSAIDPETPSQLLTIDPSAFFFNQLNPAAIENQSRTGGLGLQVAAGSSLLLAGGNVNVNGGIIVAQGGRIDLGGLSEAGAIELAVADNNFQLQFPENVARANVLLTNDAGLYVAADGGGDVAIHANDLTISGSSAIDAGILYNAGSGNPQAGNIALDTTGTLTITNPGSYVFNYINTNTIGNSGDITFNAEQLLVQDGAQVAVINFGGEGNIGSLSVRASESVEVRGHTSALTGLFIRVNSPNAVGNAGNLVIHTETLKITDGAWIENSTYGQGNVGTIDITAQGSITLSGGESNSFIFNNVESGGVGNTAGINIATGSLLITGGSQIQTSVLGRGDSGPIQIVARDQVSLDGRIGNDRIPSTIRSNVVQGATGDSGGIDIDARLLSITGRSQITSTTEGNGSPGDIDITASDRVFLLNSIIISEVTEGTGVGQGGDITISTGTLELRNASSLLADTENRGNAGNITIDARDAVILAGRGPSAGDINSDIPSQITTTVDFTGNSQGEGGSIDITTGSLSMADEGFIRSSTFGQGNAGPLTITADEIQLMGDSFIASNVARNAVGNSGIMRITANALSLTEDSVILTSTSGQGSAGDIFITVDDIQLADNSEINSGVRARGIGDGGDIIIEADAISLTEGARISALVERQQRDEQDNIIPGGQGRGGDLRITASESISLSGTSEEGFSSGFFTLTQRGAVGRAGDIYITTDNLQLTDGAIVVASTYNPSRGGNITINAENLSARSGGQIVTSTRSSGNAGNIIVDVADTIAIAGFDPNFADRQQQAEQFISTSEGQYEQISDIINNEGANSGIFANTTPNSLGTGGTITIDVNTLTLRNRGQISAATSGSGSAGNITIRDADRVSLNQATITTAVNPGSVLSRSARERGNITIQSDRIRLRNNANITANTSGTGDAGNIELQNARSIELSGSSVISTEVAQTAIGRGGNIEIETEDLTVTDRARITASTEGQGRAGSITIDSNAVRLANRGQLTTSTTTDQLAGNITLNTTDLNVTDRARISARSEGTGIAGDIEINASGLLEARDGDIETIATNSSGGDINVEADRIQLYGDSDIRTNSSVDGGNITLSASSILAFDDSDIIAAAGNQGGDITLNTAAYFGENYQADTVNQDPESLEGNDRADINASGAQPGIITTPDTSLIQNSLTELPDTAIDTDTLVANSCVVRSRTQVGTFVITGSEGLPQRPGSTAPSSYPTSPVRSVPGASGVDDDRSWQPGDAIVEPQGAYQLEDGRLVLSRECLEEGR